MLRVDKWVDVRVGLHRIITSIARRFGDAEELRQRRGLPLAVIGDGVFDMGDIPGVSKHVFYVLRIEAFVASTEAIAKVRECPQIRVIGQLDGRDASRGRSKNRIVILK